MNKEEDKLLKKLHPNNVCPIYNCFGSPFGIHTTLCELHYNGWLKYRDTTFWQDRSFEDFIWRLERDENS